MMFRNQRGNIDIGWILIYAVIGVFIIAAFNIVRHGFEITWEQFLSPSSLAWIGEVLLKSAIFLGAVIGGILGGLILWALFILAYNYFIIYRKEPNLKCRILGHTEPFLAENNCVICGRCGKDFREC